MKHCQHCRIEKRFHLFRAKRVGLLGAILMGLHLLFHVFELLILPSAFMLFSGHLAEEPATATSNQPANITSNTTGSEASTLVWPCQTSIAHSLSFSLTDSNPLTSGTNLATPNQICPPSNTSNTSNTSNELSSPSENSDRTPKLVK